MWYSVIYYIKGPTVTNTLIFLFFSTLTNKTLGLWKVPSSRY